MLKSVTWAWPAEGKQSFTIRFPSTVIKLITKQVYYLYGLPWAGVAILHVMTVLINIRAQQTL